MTARFPRRASTALLLGVLAVIALGGCDPVSWARSTPSEHPEVSRSPRASAATAGPTTTDTGIVCTSDTRTLPRSQQVSLDALGGGDLTQASAAAGSRAISVGKGTLRLNDFSPFEGTVDGVTVRSPALGLLGAGEGRTVLEVAPGTSTRAGDIPKDFPNTNQLYVLRVAGPSVLGGFKVRGTEQGHLYNGLMADHTDDLVASRITVTGIPGDDSRPPGETFGINDYKTLDSSWSHVTVDGAGVGASGFATNGSDRVHLCDVESKDNRSAMGFAFWQSSDLVLTDCRAIDNGFSGFNFERVTGSNTLIRPVATGNRYGMRIASDRSSARFRIVDPQLTDGHFTVTLPKRFYGTTNKQKRSDITLVVDGKARPDLLRFQTY